MYRHEKHGQLGGQLAKRDPKFRDEVKRLRGYDPLFFLPAQMGHILEDAEIHGRFQWDMRMTVKDLLLENYAGH